MNNLENIIGYISAVCTTIAYVPQVLKVYKTKSTRDISLGMFLLMNAGIAGWLVYGVLLNKMPIIAANFVSLLLTLYILGVKLKNYYMDKLSEKQLALERSKNL